MITSPMLNPSLKYFSASFPMAMLSFFMYSGMLSSFMNMSSARSCPFMAILNLAASAPVN